MIGKIRNSLFLLCLMILALASSTAFAQGGGPAPTDLTATPSDNNSVVLNFNASTSGTTELLALEDGPTGGDSFGYGAARGKKRLLWLNRLTPSQYPATLTKAIYAFVTLAGYKENDDINLRIYKDPEGDGPAPNQQPDIEMPIKVKLNNLVVNFAEYDVSAKALTINSGSFLIGLYDNEAGLEFPVIAAHTLQSPEGAGSFLSTDGGQTYTSVDANGYPTGISGFLSGTKVKKNWAIRAEVSTGAQPTGFNVYRSTSTPVATTAANKIATLPITATSYTDTNIPGANGATVFYYVVTASYGSTESAPSNEVSVSPGSPDFSLGLTPANQTVTPGASTTFTVTPQAISGFADMVNLTATLAPTDANVTAALSSATVAPGASSTVTVTAAAGAATGDFVVTVTGTSGQLTHTSTAQLRVQGPDFTLAFNPATVTIQRNSKGQFTVNVNRFAGFTGSVSVTPPDTKAIKVKITPASQSTTGTTVSFNYKAKKTATASTQQLVFTGKDSSGRVRTATLTVIIQ